jgi:hypothetical protein
MEISCVRILKILGREDWIHFLAFTIEAVLKVLLLMLLLLWLNHCWINIFKN